MTPQQGNAPDFSKAGNSVRKNMWGEPWTLHVSQEGESWIEDCDRRIITFSQSVGVDARALNCVNALAGVENPAQWVKAVEEAIAYFSLIQDESEERTKILAKLSAARTGGKE